MDRRNDPVERLKDLRNEEMKKKDRALNFLEENIDLFQCSICKSRFNELNDYQLQCSENHSFDISKKGTIHFLLKQVSNEYNKDMLEARAATAEKGLWHPLLSEIMNYVENKEGVHLDVGCGEGSHLHRLSELGLLGRKIGFDISKDAIQLAAAHYNDAFWCVADLADSPFADGKYDTIFNILSPSNYSEFDRLLKKDGQVIKVVPNQGYLKELREGLYDDQKPYSNEKVVKRFYDHYKSTCERQVRYSMELKHKEIPHLLKMTPLSLIAEEEKKKAFLNKSVLTITVDLTILIGSN